MHTKFLIFLIMGTLLVAAIYSSYVSVVFGGTSTSCTASDKTHTTCVVNETDAAGKYTSTFWDCTYHKTTKTWSCTEAASQPPTPGLNNAITGAKSGATAAGAATTGGGNNTNVLEGKVLKHGGAMKGGETDNNPPPTISNDTLQ